MSTAIQEGTPRASRVPYRAVDVMTSRASGWLLLVVVGLVLPYVLHASSLQTATLVLFTWAGAAPLNLVSGNAGLFSLGYVGLLAIGGFVAGILGDNAGLPWVVCLLGATAAGLVSGVIVALPTLRWRGMYVILGTMALHFVALFAVVRLGEAVGRPTGFTFPIMTVFGHQVASDRGLYYLMFAMAMLAVYVCATLEASRAGRAWVAARENRIVSEAVGVDVGHGSIVVFAVSSALIGLLGGVYGYFIGVFSFESLSLSTAIEYIAIILLGGLGSPLGALLGSAFYVGLPYLVTWLIEKLPAQWQETMLPKQPYVEVGIFGLVIVAVILVEPRGLVHIAARIGSAARNRLVATDAGHLSRAPHDASVIDSADVLRPLVGGPEWEPVASDALLAVTDLTVSYGSAGPVLHHVSLTLQEGAVLGIVGANGAGKSTLARAVSGFHRAEQAKILSGSITWKGKRLDGREPSQIARLGVVAVPETDKVFPSLTVKEHFDLVERSLGRQFEMEEIFERFPALKDRWTRQAGYLSGGERQMLAVARALRQGPELLVLDELSLGLAPIVVVDLVAALESLCKQGDLSLIIVEQTVEIVEQLASDVVVLDRGRLVGRGTPDELKDSGVFTSAYLGTSDEATS